MQGNRGCHHDNACRRRAPTQYRPSEPGSFCGSGGVLSNECTRFRGYSRESQDLATAAANREVREHRQPLPIRQRLFGECGQQVRIRVSLGLTKAHPLAYDLGQLIHAYVDLLTLIVLRRSGCNPVVVDPLTSTCSGHHCIFTENQVLPSPAGASTFFIMERRNCRILRQPVADI
jgi:hypothetical protein